MDSQTNLQQLYWISLSFTNNQGYRSVPLITIVALAVSVCYMQSDLLTGTQWGISQKQCNLAQECNMHIIDESTAGLLSTTWQQSKQRLCPNGIPNVTFGPLLFELASEALSDKNMSWPTGVQNTPSTNSMASQFYHGFFGDWSLYTDPNFSYVYIRIYKCGNNFIRGWQEQIFGENSTTATATNDREPAGSGYHHSIKIKQAMSILSQQQHAPCIVTAIRDPISHFLSGYNEIEWRTSKHLYDPIAEPKPAYLNVNYTTEQERKERFTEFVTNVVQGEWDVFNRLQGKHFTSMSRVLSALEQQGLKLTAYLPSVANLSTTWPSFVDANCPGIQSSFPNFTTTVSLRQTLGLHESSKDEVGFYKASQSVWEEGGKISEALCILHAMDYACWENLPDGIPEICQRVFESDNFVNAIVSG